MNIEQLESYNLADAIKFHDKLNPLIWDKSEHLKPEIRDQLLLIADDFAQSLGIDDLALEDITISGSNAAYTYTSHSDIDLHLIVDVPDDDVYKELFKAKKFIYNTDHKITIKGIPVELYVQDSKEVHHSQGIYSVLNNKWLQIPRRRKAEIDDISTRSKYEDLADRIKEALASDDKNEIRSVIDRIAKLRQTGLDQHGEFGPENLAFKMLRSQGLIKELYDTTKDIKSRELSLKEREKLKLRKPVKYGYGVDFIDEVTLTPDGTSPTTSEFTNEVTMTPDGTSPTTSQFTNEGVSEETVQDFVTFCTEQLGLEQEPELKLRRDPEWSKRAKTFGRYDSSTNRLEVSVAGRHLMDVLRTIAHELTHQHQHEREDVPHDAGDTGSPWENEANARAGILMRDYGHTNPNLFGTLSESSGYIPTAAQAHDPRFEMALTNDVRPGATGKAANAFLLNTDAQGHPQELRPDGMVFRMMEEYKKFKQ